MYRNQYHVEIEEQDANKEVIDKLKGRLLNMEDTLREQTQTSQLDKTLITSIKEENFHINDQFNIIRRDNDKLQNEKYFIYIYIYSKQLKEQIEESEHKFKLERCKWEQDMLIIEERAQKWESQCREKERSMEDQSSSKAALKNEIENLTKQKQLHDTDRETMSMSNRQYVDENIKLKQEIAVLRDNLDTVLNFIYKYIYYIYI